MNGMIIMIILVAVAIMVVFMICRKKKIEIPEIDLPKGKVTFKIETINARDGKYYTAKAFRGDKFLGSITKSSQKEIITEVESSVDFLRKWEDDGYEITKYFGRPDATRDGKKYHGNPSDGTWSECIYVPDFPRADDDGRCLICEGWGCCSCGHTGGY